MAKAAPSPRQTAQWLLRHPAEYGRRLGYTLLTDNLHGLWMRRIIWGVNDMTLQAHRGAYKTSCLAVALAVIMQIHRESNIIFLRKTDNDVAEVLQSVRSLLLHPLTQAMCQALTARPLELYKATNKQITTSLYSRTGGAPQLLGIGLGGSLTGKHADIIITDDIVNRLDRASRAERERTKLIYQELQNLRNPGGRIINSGTPWHKEDAFTLMPPPEKYDCYTTGLLTAEQIADLRQRMAPSLFAANYELRHIASEGALFTTMPATVRETDDLGNHRLADGYGIAHIDAAYGGEDYTALTLARKVGDTIYLYGRLWHSHVDTVLNHAIALCKAYRCGPIWVELNGDKGYLSREIRNWGYDAFGYTEEQNKYIKISTYLRKWWGNIRLIQGTDQDYISQILDYTDTAAHDDAPDSASVVCRILDRQ
jgi:hypothetical protein